MKNSKKKDANHYQHKRLRNQPIRCLDRHKAEAGNLSMAGNIMVKAVATTHIAKAGGRLNEKIYEFHDFLLV